MNGTLLVIWLCGDDVSVQEPHTKIREEIGEQEENWENTFYPLLSPSLELPIHTCSTYSSAPRELEI